MPGSAAPAAVLRGVSTILDGGVHALRGVDLTIRGGEVTVLLGPSGSGKSTLLRHINGLQSPTSGGVETLGVRVDAADPARLRALRRRVAMIFQHFHLVGPLSALENVCAGRLGSLRGPRLGLITYPRTVRSAALEQLDRVGLADLAHQRADTLSGGQRQRVAIARALLQEPELLLADEPVASLDPVTGGQVIGLLDRIAREDGLTVVCSLHQVGTALGFADRIVGLNNGRVVLDAPADRLSREQALTIYDRTDPAPAPH